MKKKHKSISSQPSPYKFKHYINFFIQERTNENHYYLFVGKNKSDSEFIHIDSVLPKLKKDILAIFNSRGSSRDESIEVGNNNTHKILYGKILAIRSKKIKDRSKSEIDEIGHLLDLVPNSKEKILLTLLYNELKISAGTPAKEIFSYGSKAKDNADMIADLYDRGKLYTYIGDFFWRYNFYHDAIKAYYRAREYFYNCNRDIKIKYYEEGEVCKKMTQIFDQKSLTVSLNKQSNYYLSAFRYYLASTDYVKAEESYYNVIATAAYTFYVTGDNEIDSVQKDLAASDLQEIKEHYSDYINKNKTYSNIVDYLCLYSIATYVRSENQRNVALKYDIEALIAAIRTKNEDFIKAGLYNVAYAYSSIGKEKLSLDYVDFAIALKSKSNNKADISFALLHKANILRLLKRYDSAFSILNGIQFEPNLNTLLFPLDYAQILEDIYDLKSKIFDSIKPGSDSTSLYRDLLSKFISEKQGFQTNLFQTESDAIKIFLENIKDEEIKKNEILYIAQKNLDYSIHRIDMLSLKTARDSVSQAISIALLKDTLAKQIDAKRIADSTINVNNMRLASEARVREREIIVTIFAFALIIGLLLYFINRAKIQKKLRKTEESRRIKEIELKQLDELARNKIHNFQNDYHVLTNMLNKGDIEKAKVYTNEWGAYQANFLENWKESQVTVEDELILLEQYCNVKRAMGKLIAFNKNSACTNINPTKTFFLQSVFDTLLDNSVRRGFKDKTGICQFDIKLERKEELLFCVITDNGIPPSDPDSYFRRIDSGLNILKSRVKAMFEVKNIPVPGDFFIAKALENQSGTIVKITMPYNEQII